MSPPVHLVKKRLMIAGKWHWMKPAIPPNCKMCKLTVYKDEEVVASIVGDIHSHPLPRITCSQLTFFPFYRCQVNRLACLAPFHYHPNIHFVNGRVDHFSEVEHLFDSRIPTLSMNARDPLWILTMCNGCTWLLQRLRFFPISGQPPLQNPSQCSIHAWSDQCYVYKLYCWGFQPAGWAASVSTFHLIPWWSSSLSVHQLSTDTCSLACHWSTMLTLFKVASSSAKFMCLESFSSQNQQASSMMAPLVSRATPMASELIPIDAPISSYWIILSYSGHGFSG